MIQRNPKKIPVFKINLQKNYVLWCLHLTTWEAHTWKTAMIMGKDGVHTVYNVEAIGKELQFASL